VEKSKNNNVWDEFKEAIKEALKIFGTTINKCIEAVNEFKGEYPKLYKIIREYHDVKKMELIKELGINHE